MTRPRPGGAVRILLLLASIVCARAADAQLYARFAVPDSLLPGAVRSSGGQFEAAWNALLIAQLRASAAHADSAARLKSLAQKIAKVETDALGSRIAPDAWALRTRWRADERRARIHGAVAESLGAAAQAARDWGHADSLFRSALLDYRRIGERRRTAWVLGSLQVAAFNAGDLPRADSLGRMSLNARRAIGDEKMEGNALYDLGNIALRAGRPADAGSWYRQSFEVRGRTGEISRRGAALRGIADATLALGNIDSALAVFPEAVYLTSSGGDSARTLEALGPWSDAVARWRDPAEAIPLRERALTIARERGDRRNEVTMLAWIGNARRAIGDYAEAAAIHQQVEQIDLDDNDPQHLAATLVDLGQAWVGLQDAASARGPLLRARALADSLGDPALQAASLSNLGIVARLENDLTAAAKFGAQALEAARRTGDAELIHSVASELGTLAVTRHELGEAAEHFTAAADAGAALGLESRAVDAGNQGAVAGLQGRLDDAEQLFEASAARADSANSPDALWAAWIGLGDVAEKRGNSMQALNWDRRAATLIDTLRARQRQEGASVKLFARRLFAYEALIHLLGKLDSTSTNHAYAAEAFQWSERARARSFLDGVATQDAGAASTPIDLAAAQRLVPDRRSALLVYSVGDSSTALWVVKGDSWRHVMLPPRRVLLAQSEILRRALGDPKSSEAASTRRAARGLYQRLIAPVEAELKYVKRVIIAPDGPLALIPFEALLTSDPPAEGEIPTKAWLVQRYEVSYVPSATVLATLQAERSATEAKNAGIVALGDPQFPAGPPSLPRLPHTSEEVAAIQALAKKRPFHSLTGAEATRETLLAIPGLPDAAVIHIATHGTADEADPRKSGLWLAAPAGQTAPGFLALTDIEQLHLNAGVVTLSACETGLGRLETGEGVIGLTRAFMGAGARSVVVSLWKVNDQSTARLMSAFYQKALPGKTTCDAALAAAKRRLLDDPATRAPFHWAPFVLQGAGQSLN